ncbi:hypothetical protein TWF281_000003 [Arthrobotrys megalospora]
MARFSLADLLKSGILLSSFLTSCEALVALKAHHHGENLLASLSQADLGHKAGTIAAPHFKDARQGTTAAGRTASLGTINAAWARPVDLPLRVVPEPTAITVVKSVSGMGIRFVLAVASVLRAKNAAETHARGAGHQGDSSAPQGPDALLVHGAAALNVVALRTGTPAAGRNKIRPSTTAKDALQINGAAVLAVEAQVIPVAGASHVNLNSVVQTCIVKPKLTFTSGNLVSIGCYTDSTAARGFPHMLSESGMSVARCGEIAANYKYAAVEYGVECHYGNVIAGSSQPTDTGCDMGCGGKLSELCGGGGRMNVYENTAYQSDNDWVSQGCYTDSTESRSLQYSYVDYNGMMVEICLDKAKGYAYAGLEYYGECYWGNTLSASSQPASSGCDKHCAGNPNTNCGGRGRISLYRNNKITPTQPDLPTFTFTYTAEPTTSGPDIDTTTTEDLTTEIETSSSPSDLSSTSTSSMSSSSPVTSDPITSSDTNGSTTSSVSSTPEPAEPTVNPGTHSYAYKGCWKDDVNWRTLVDGVTEEIQDGMTVDKCLSIANARQARYAGVEFGGECWVDNIIQKIAGEASMEDCRSVCSGNSLEICGGDGRLDLYETQAFFVPPTPLSIISVTRELKEAIDELQAAIAELMTAVQEYLEQGPSAKLIRRQPGAVTTAYNRFTGSVENIKRRLGKWEQDMDDGIPLMDMTIAAEVTGQEDPEQKAAEFRQYIKDVVQQMGALVQRVRDNARAVTLQIAIRPETQEKFTRLGLGVAGFGIIVGDILQVFGRLFHLNPNTGSPTGPGGPLGTPPVIILPPPQDPTPTPSPTSSTSTSSCSATAEPTRFLIIFKKGTTTAQITAFKEEVPEDNRNIDLDYPSIGIRVHLAHLDECEAATALDHTIVEAMAPDVLLDKLDKGFPESPGSEEQQSTRIRKRNPENNGSKSKETQRHRLEARNFNNPNLGYTGEILERTQPPMHLEWLGNFQHQTAKQGSFYNYRFLQKEDQGGNGIVVYVIETHLFLPTHSEIAGKILGYIPQPQLWPAGSPTDYIHGTCMASLINGRWAGVAKLADLMLVSIGAAITINPPTHPDSPSSVTAASSAGLAWSLLETAQDIQNRNIQRNAVVSMSFESIRHQTVNSHDWGTSQATALTAGVIASILSDPAERAILNSPQYQNFNPWGYRVKRRLLDLAVEAKGNFADVPRTVAGTLIPCIDNPAFRLPPSNQLTPFQFGAFPTITTAMQDEFTVADGGVMQGNANDPNIICIDRP